MNKYCSHCGASHQPKFASQTLCFPKCVNKRDIALAEYDGLKATIAGLRAEVAEARARRTPKILSSRAIKLIKQKCHPDLCNDAYAGEVLIWANSL
jgi:hypothetical protein